MELHVSLVCAIPNAPWLEYIPQLESLTHASMRMEKGRAYPSSTPGLGINWDLSAITAARIANMSAEVSA